MVLGVMVLGVMAIGGTLARAQHDEADGTCAGTVVSPSSEQGSHLLA